MCGVAADLESKFNTTVCQPPVSRGDSIACECSQLGYVAKLRLKLSPSTTLELGDNWIPELAYKISTEPKWLAGWCAQ